MNPPTPRAEPGTSSLGMIATWLLFFGNGVVAGLILVVALAARHRNRGPLRALLCFNPFVVVPLLSGLGGAIGYCSGTGALMGPGMMDGPSDLDRQYRCHWDRWG
ncbi:MAG: hypothetical protein HZA54_17395 [Planctomycetes bacterium]|nr:hypothetical protein [Planctomycetota bacterium]